MATKEDVTHKFVTFEDELHEEIWCQFCNGVYESPILLPCLHSLCKKCLKVIEDSQNGRLSCPVCLTDVECKPEQLLPNLLAQKRVEELNRKRHASRREPCGGCEHHPQTAQFRCTQCEEYLCDECIQAHKRVKFTKDHEIISFLETSEREKQISKKSNDVYCLIHKNQILDKFCVACDVPVCKECPTGVHSDQSEHKHVTMWDIFDSAKSELEELLNETRLRIPELQKNVYEIIKTYAKVEKKVEDITWQIRQTSRHLIQAVKAREHQLLQELYAVQERRCKGLTEEKEIMERKLVKTIDGCDFTDDVLRQPGSEAKILLVKKVVRTRLKHLLEEKVEVQPEKIKITFEAKEEPVVHAINDAFGSLTVEQSPPATCITSLTSDTADKNQLDTADKNQLSQDERDNEASPAALAGSVSEPILNVYDEQSDNIKSSGRRFSLPPISGKKGGKAFTKTKSATTFTVATMDHKDQHKDVQVKLETPDNSIISAHVLDNKDGTYTVFYCPKTPGEHNVYISLSSKEIKHGSRLLNIYGSFKNMRSEELALACKTLCLIRWQITPGLVQMKNNKPVTNPKVSFKDLEPGHSEA